MDLKLKSEYNTKLSFIGVYYDFDLRITQNLLVSYFPYNKTIQLFDLDSNRIVLRRIRSENLQLEDFFARNRIEIVGRQIDLKDYADNFTRGMLENKKQLNLILVKPSVVSRMGEIITDVVNLNYAINRMKMCVLTRKQALSFYAKRIGDIWLPFIIEGLMAGPIIAMELYGENAIARLRKESGNVDPEIARKENPGSLRAKYGVTRITNAFHLSATPEKAHDEADYFFPLFPDAETDYPKPTFQFQNSTCCVIKPHVVSAKNLGKILSDILNHGLFKITGLQMIHLYHHQAEEFLQVYRSVVSDYKALVLSVLGGPCVVLEISGVNEDIDVQGEFKKFAGPIDSCVAKLIRPTTLRAVYGIDKYNNALHCTDLPEDTSLEIGYFFKGLD